MYRMAWLIPHLLVLVILVDLLHHGASHIFNSDEVTKSCGDESILDVCSRTREDFPNALFQEAVSCQARLDPRTPQDAQNHFESHKFDLGSVTKILRSCLHGQDSSLKYRIKRSLIGNGAHRMLKFSITRGSSDQSTLENAYEGCKFIVLQQFPRNVFVDPYEMHRLTTQDNSSIENFHISGDTNLERPATHSCSSLVELHMHSLTFNANMKTKQQFDVSIPLHARYPPLCKEMHYNVEIDNPHPFLYCPNSRNVKLVHMLAGESLVSSDRVQWTMPAGNLGHSMLVTCSTLLTAVLGVVIILIVSYSHYLSNQDSYLCL